MRTALVISLCAALAGCSKKEAAPTVGSGSGSDLGSAGSGSAYAALGHKPANARRATPPPGIEAAAVAVGATAPDVELADAVTGTPWKLGDALAAYDHVMILFYRGDWCPHCRKQLGEIQSMATTFEQKKIGFVAISVDEPPAGKALAEKMNLMFPILSDPKATTLKAYGVFDPENEIAWASIFIVGKDKKIEKRWLADTFSQRIATADVIADLPAAH